MSKRKAEQFTSLIAGYGSDDDDSEHEQSDDGDEGGGDLLLGYGHDEDEAQEPGASQEGPGSQHEASPSQRGARTPHDDTGTSGEGDGQDSAAPGAGKEGGGDRSADGGAGAKPSSEIDQDYSILPEELREPPPGDPAPEAKAQVEKLFKAAQQGAGKLLSSELRASRLYQNPDFLRKMVVFFDIQERGSCFPKDVFDPAGLPAEDHVAELRKEWGDGRKVKERKAVDFKPGGVQAPPVVHPGLHAPPVSLATAQAIAQAQAKANLMASKKTKWDSGGGAAGRG